MADTKISALPASTTPLAGTEVLPIVQGGVTKQVSVANLTAGRAISATQLTLTTGNVIPAAGQGIDFSANSSAPGMTSELFNDYETGTWTPAVTPTGGGSVSYNTQSGFYTKVGNVVTVNAWIGGSTLSSPLGDVSLTGFPFAVVSNNPRANAYLACNAITGGGGITGQLSGYLFNSTMFVNIINNGSLSTLAASKLNTSFEFYISFSYLTA